MDALAGLPAPWLGAIALPFGLAIGSFLNVVIHRLPRGESIVSPRSHCPRCGLPLQARDNVPLLSYLWLRGRCRGCGGPISLRYPAIELFTGALFALVAARHGATLTTLVLLPFAAALVASAVIDFEHHIIPDQISVGGLLLALVLVPAVQAVGGTPLSVAMLHTLAGALLGGGLLWSVGFLHARVSVALGRRFEHWPGEGEAPPRPASLDYWVWFPGLGFGDVKLLAMVGAVVGPFGVIETIFAAALLGLALGIGWALVTGRWDAPFGFAPAIAAGALLVILAPGGFAPF